MSNDTPFMRWQVDAYMGDTGHLTCVEHGAYTQTLWACWKRGGSVPERHIRRLVGMTEEQWAESRDTLAEFFSIDDGQWTHLKVIEEIDYVASRLDKATKAGKASANARRKRDKQNMRSTVDEHTLNACPANVEHTLNTRSTVVEQPINYEEEEEEIDEDLDTESSLATLKKSAASPSEFLDRLMSVHGYQPRPHERLAIITQAKQWIEDGVSDDEVDVAVEQSRELLRLKGDHCDPPMKYVAKVLAGNRNNGAPIPAGARSDSAETHEQRAERLFREKFGDDPDPEMRVIQ